MRLFKTISKYFNDLDKQLLRKYLLLHLRKYFEEVTKLRTKSSNPLEELIKKILMRFFKKKFITFTNKEKNAN